MTTVNKSDKDRIVIFDTTLRDGEQCPGATMSFEEKLEVAEMLDDMGVDVIEAGFPITSEGDFQAVSEIARRSKNAVIAGLSRAHPQMSPARATISTTSNGRRKTAPAAKWNSCAGSSRP
jgi:2-isopropylmalate synthase